MRKGESNAALRGAAHTTKMRKRENSSAAGESKLKQRQYQTVLVASFGLILWKWDWTSDESIRSFVHIRQFGENLGEFVGS
jgi:hypothetical protein